MQLHNNHQRLVKRLLPRFSPTWLGGGDPEPTSTAAVGPPAAVTPPPPSPTPTPDPTPTPTPTPDPVQTSASQPPPQSEPVQQTSSVQTIPTQTQEVTTISSTAPTTSAAIPTTTSLSSLVVPTTTSTPPARVTTPRASVPQSSAAPGTLTVKSATVRSFTNSNGGIVYSTIFEAPEPTTSSAPTQSNVGPIVGAIAGSLVGIVCLIAFISWIIRMHNKRKDRNNDDFDRQSYLRNSMMIPDEAPGAGRPVIGTQAALALARSNTAVGPRPPTMIERKATYGMYGAQASPSFAPGQVVSFDPGQMGSAPPSAGNGYPSPMAFAAYTPPAEHHQSELTRRPSGATLLTRQPTNGGMYNQGYPQQSPVSYSPDSYHPHHDGYTYPMANERNMVQSVTPFQAQQYAEITRQLEGDSNGHTNDSFHPMSPVDHSPVGYAVSDDAHPIEMPLSNPFEEKPKARVASTAPALPPLGLEDGQLSRTGTPIDPNPQHAHWSYDAKSAQPGTRLSVAGMPTLPPAAHTREEKTVVVGNGEAMPPQHANGKRPVSIVDEDDIYGGM